MPKSLQYLEAVTELLDGFSLDPLEIPEDELCNRYEKLYSGAINGNLL